MRWCDFTGDGKWETGSNWAGGDGIHAPTSSDDVTFAITSGVANSADNCTCSAVDGTTVAKSITIGSPTAYNGRVHFDASSGATLTVGAGGIQMYGGGIEQDNGCTLRLAGDFSMNGGELNAESSATGTLTTDNVQGRNLSFTAPASSLPGIHVYKVGDSIILNNDNDLMAVDIGDCSGSHSQLKVSKNAFVRIDKGLLNWTNGDIVYDGVAGTTVLKDNGGKIWK
jgi:hypothetical protein